MFMEETSVTLSDMREIFLNDDDDIIISMKRDDEILHTFEVPFPSAGYGGGMLMLSPSERYLVFSFYSGQSEEAYILFEIQDSCLEFIYGTDYLYGEGISYLFSEREELLYQALPKSLGPWYREDAEENAKGELIFEFCQINVLDIQRKTVACHSIQVVPSEHWDDEWAEGEPPCLMEIIDCHALSIVMPWGEEQLALPLNDRILFRPS